MLRKQWPKAHILTKGINIHYLKSGRTSSAFNWSLQTLLHTAAFLSLYIYIYIYIYIYTGCPRRNVPDFGRVFLKLTYTDITQNTYVQSWTATEIMAIANCGLLAVPRTVPVSRDVLRVHCACPSLILQPGQAHSRCDLVSKVVNVTVNCEEL